MIELILFVGVFLVCVQCQFTHKRTFSYLTNFTEPTLQVVLLEVDTREIYENGNIGECTELKFTQETKNEYGYYQPEEDIRFNIECCCNSEKTLIWLEAYAYQNLTFHLYYGRRSGEVQYQDTGNRIYPTNNYLFFSSQGCYGFGEDYEENDEHFNKFLRVTPDYDQAGDLDETNDVREEHTHGLDYYEYEYFSSIEESFQSKSLSFPGEEISKYGHVHEFDLTDEGDSSCEITSQAYYLCEISHSNFEKAENMIPEGLIMISGSVLPDGSNYQYIPSTTGFLSSRIDEFSGMTQSIKSSHEHYIFGTLMPNLTHSIDQQVDVGGGFCSEDIHIHYLTTNSTSSECEPEYYTFGFQESLHNFNLPVEQMGYIVTNFDPQHFPIHLYIENNTDYHGKYLRHQVGLGSSTGGKKTHSHGIGPKDSYWESLEYRKTCPMDDPMAPYSSTYGHRHSFTGNMSVVHNELPHIKVLIARRKIPDLKMENVVLSLSDEFKYYQTCFGKSGETACNGVYGDCVTTDVCVCAAGNHVYGRSCGEEVKKAKYTTSNIISIPYKMDTFELYEALTSNGIEEITDFKCEHIIMNIDNFGRESTCKWISESLIQTSEIEMTVSISSGKNEIFLVPVTYMGVYNKDEISFRVEVQSYTLTIIQDFWYILVIIPVLCCTGCCLFCICCCCIHYFCCCSLICETCLGFYCCRFWCIRIKFGRYKALYRQIDILLDEQDAQKYKRKGKKGAAALKISEQFFVIPYKDIHVKDQIGEGGSQSVVFRAIWSGKNVGFKVFRTTDLTSEQMKFEEFERECEILASINHPNILSFYGASVMPPRVGIVMEYCENGDMFQFLRKRYRQSNEEEKYPDRLRFLQEVCSGMKYLHSRNIIHRDLKLENVLITKEEVCKIMDFGMSKMVERVSQTMTKRLGTSINMAPEVVRGTEYKESCDVFSFSIMIFQIVTHKFQPYGAHSDFQLEFKVASDPNFRPHIDEEEWEGMEWIIKIVRRCWDNDPEIRPKFEDLVKLFSLDIENEEVEDEESMFPKEMFKAGGGPEEITDDEGVATAGTMVKNQNLREVIKSIKNTEILVSQIQLENESILSRISERRRLIDEERSLEDEKIAKEVAKKELEEIEKEIDEQKRREEEDAKLARKLQKEFAIEETHRIRQEKKDEIIAKRISSASKKKKMVKEEPIISQEKENNNENEKSENESTDSSDHSSNDEDENTESPSPSSTSSEDSNESSSSVSEEENSEDSEDSEEDKKEEKKKNLEIRRKLFEEKEVGSGKKRRKSKHNKNVSSHSMFVKSPSSPRRMEMLDGKNVAQSMFIRNSSAEHVPGVDLSSEFGIDFDSGKNKKKKKKKKK